MIDWARVAQAHTLLSRSDGTSCGMIQRLFYIYICKEIEPELEKPIHCDRNECELELELIDNKLSEQIDNTNKNVNDTMNTLKDMWECVTNCKS